MAGNGSQGSADVYGRSVTEDAALGLGGVVTYRFVMRLSDVPQ